MRERNRLNSQEWAIEFAREEDRHARRPEPEPRDPAVALDEVVSLLERGAVDLADGRVERLRRALDALETRRGH